MPKPVSMKKVCQSSRPRNRICDQYCEAARAGCAKGEDVDTDKGRVYDDKKQCLPKQGLFRRYGSLLAMNLVLLLTLVALTQIKTIDHLRDYDEQDNIANTVHDITEHCPDMDYIVINDCSKDDTLSVLQQNDMTYLSLLCNLGIGGSVQTGYRYAAENGYDIAIQFDGDGQHDARYIDALIAPIGSGTAA